MKKILISLAAVLLVMAGTDGVSSSEKEKLSSLRGGVPLDAESAQPRPMEQNTDKDSIKRSFPLNPPMIPHEIDDYEISTSKNPCLSCHEDAASGAKVLGESHYLDREAKHQKVPAARRYFCTQCHAVQVKVEPIVENKYKP